MSLMRIHYPKLRKMTPSLSLSFFTAFKRTNLNILFTWRDGLCKGSVRKVAFLKAKCLLKKPKRSLNRENCFLALFVYSLACWVLAFRSVE